jgi:hypothetical protein
MARANLCVSRQCDLRRYPTIHHGRVAIMRGEAMLMAAPGVAFSSHARIEFVLIATSLTRAMVQPGERFRSLSVHSNSLVLPGGMVQPVDGSRRDKVGYRAPQEFSAAGGGGRGRSSAVVSIAARPEWCRVGGASKDAEAARLRPPGPLR